MEPLEMGPGACPRHCCPHNEILHYLIAQHRIPTAPSMLSPEPPVAMLFRASLLICCSEPQILQHKCSASTTGRAAAPFSRHKVMRNFRWEASSMASIYSIAAFTRASGQKI